MRVSGNELDSRDLEAVFNGAFAESFGTLLIGGAEEPLYRPAGDDESHHQLFYREDYFSSALHEIAHWCIAGAQRRKQLDFGYWYNPDGRTREQQRSFEQVEVKPQALEWIFSTAAGVYFNVSADNLSTDDDQAAGPSQQFLLAVERQAVAYCAGGLPPRAEIFIHALQRYYRTADPLDSQLYAGRFSS